MNFAVWTYRSHCPNEKTPYYDHVWGHHRRNLPVSERQLSTNAFAAPYGAGQGRVGRPAYCEIRAVAKAPAAMCSTTGSAFLEMWAGQGSLSANFDRCAGQDSIARLPTPSGAASICRLARLQNTSCNDLKTHDNQITFLWTLMRISDIFAS